MWIVLSINNSRYQSWQVSVLIWSIELSISYVSLKSDNITCVEMSYVLAYRIELVNERVCGKCIVGQSSAKFDKVDMFSKQAIKKQSWQSWCIFLSIFKNIMQSKVGKVEMWIHYSRQSWQSSDFYISNNGQSS